MNANCLDKLPGQAERAARKSAWLFVGSAARAVHLRGVEMHDLKFLFASLVVMLSACAIEDPDAADDQSSDSQDLLNGTPTTARPEVAKFLVPSGGGAFCTATVISPTTFITAAHCIDNAPMESGGSLLFVNGTSIQVVRTFAQGAFGNDNDIAIGLLSSNAPFSPGSISSTEPVPGLLTVVD